MGGVVGVKKSAEVQKLNTKESENLRKEESVPKEETNSLLESGDNNIVKEIDPTDKNEEKNNNISSKTEEKVSSKIEEKVSRKTEEKVSSEEKISSKTEETINSKTEENVKDQKETSSKLEETMDEKPNNFEEEEENKVGNKSNDDIRGHINKRENEKVDNAEQNSEKRHKQTDSDEEAELAMERRTISVGEVEVYQLDTNLCEKEESVSKQIAVKDRYHKWNHKKATLSEKAKELGLKFFLPYGLAKTLPGRPDKSGRKGFYVKGKRFVAFRGVGGLDMAKIWHMLIIPLAAPAGFDKKTFDSENNLLKNQQEENDHSLQWVFDLTTTDLYLIEQMKAGGLAFLRTNRDYFLQLYSEQKEEELGGKSVEYWLREENVLFGFHTIPSVGYLHMHMLIGPLTEFGANANNMDRWISLDTIIETLKQGENASSLLREQEELEANNEENTTKITKTVPPEITTMTSTTAESQ